MIRNRIALFHENLRNESQEPILKQLDKAILGILKMEKVLSEIKDDYKSVHEDLVYIKDNPDRDSSPKVESALDFLRKSEEKLDKCLRMRSIKAAQRKRYHENFEGMAYRVATDVEKSYWHDDAKDYIKRQKQLKKKRKVKK